MSFFKFLGDIFRPAADLIDNLHVSDEERGMLRNQFAEIEARVSIQMMELQAASIEATSKLAVAEQKYGSILSRNWRPIASLSLLVLIMAMGLEFIPINTLILQIAGGFLGIFGIGRTLEKRTLGL